MTKKIILFVPYSKTTGFKGKLLDIYPLANDRRCPSAAMLRLKKLAEIKGIWDPISPVFSFCSGKNLPISILNKILSSLLGDFCDPFHKITGHSFRAGIPTIVASHPDQSKVSELMDWGSWESSSYKIYTKSDRDKRKVLFEKIVKCMDIE